MTGIGGFADWFAWRPELGTRAIVVPLDEPESVLQLELPPFWFFHLGATGRRGDRLEIDVVASENDQVIRALDTREEAPPPTYTRLSLPLDGGSPELRPLFEPPCEFPRVDPRVAGDNPAHCWVSSRPGGIARLDLEGGAHEVWTGEDSLATSEPVMIPRGGRPGEGWVLSLAHDDERDESATLVFDAERVADGPLARVWWGQTIPTTYHGCFVG